MRAAIVLTMTWALASSAMTQRYPVKPVRLVVAFTAGGDIDIIARAVGEALSKSLRKVVNIENRPDAGGTIAAGAIARADADGYTFLIHSSGHAVTARACRRGFSGAAKAQPVWKPRAA